MPDIPGAEVNGTEIFRNLGVPREIVPTFRKIRTTGIFGNYCLKKIGFQYFSVVNYWKFPSETEWNGSIQPGWYNKPTGKFTVPICEISNRKFLVE